MVRLTPDRRLSNVNRELLRLGVYSTNVADSAEQGLQALGRSVKGLKESEQLQKAWDWFEKLEKNNPTLANAVLKTYLETVPGAKWAGALFRGMPSPLPHEVSPDEHGSTNVPLADEMDDKTVSLIKKLHQQHPELADYHVILLPRESLSDAAAGSQGNGGNVSSQKHESKVG